MGVYILIGDVFEQLAPLPDASVHCVVTSPPYWGLRDYGTPGQIGLEPTLGEHIDTLVAVFREIRRVLRADGTVWLNYGDCYATAPNGRRAADTKAAGNDDRTFRDKPFSTVGPIYGSAAENTRKGPYPTHVGRIGGGRGAPAGGTLKPKDLCMIPARLAIALQDDGWWVRSEIIWHKPNPMPESIKDRPAVAHEKIWLLTKSARYYYDAEAVRQRRSSNEDANGFRGGSYVGGVPSGRQVTGNKRTDKQRGHGRRHAGFNERWDGISRAEQQAKGANLRNVWTIATRPFSEAHFATFPPEIPERCIKAGCPEGGVVLDPFGGAGTTGLVADRLGRDAILIELNPDYAALARKRIDTDAATRGQGPEPVMRGDDLPLFGPAAGTEAGDGA